MTFNHVALAFNPIPAGVLENHPLNPLFLCPNMTNDTSLENSCAQHLEFIYTFLKSH